MRVENCSEDQGRGGPRSCKGSMLPRTGMDGDIYQDTPHRRRSFKSKAPSPPVALHGPAVSSGVPVFPNTAMEQEKSPLEQELALMVVLPEGVEKSMTVHGSEPVMDLLVMLCAKYHLNPSGYTIELVSANKKHIKFKPNSLIGALEAEKVLLKPKGMEDKNKKTGPQMPEATVRLVINYKRTQKTFLRVNPQVPLRELLPAICEKCEFEVQNTVLLRTINSEEPLDLNCCLNDLRLSDLGPRELYARDTRVNSPTNFPPSPTHSDIIQPGKDKLQKEKENKGLFGMFKRGSKKKLERASTVSAPASPINRRARPMSMSAINVHSPPYDSNTMPADMPKKKRAPLPPNMRPPDLNHQHSNSQTASQSDGNQVRRGLSRSLSSESSLKSIKRRAPPPPTSADNLSLTQDVKMQDTSSTTDLPTTLEEIQENPEAQLVTETPAVPVSSSPESLSPVQELLEDDSSINLSADVSLDSGRAGTASPSQGSEMDTVAPPGESALEVSCDLTTDGKLSAASEENRDQLDADARLQPVDSAGSVKTTTATKDESTDTMDISEDILTPTQRAEPQVPPKPARAVASVQTIQDVDLAEASGGQTNVTVQTEAWKSTEPLFSPPSEPNSSMVLTSGGSKRNTGTYTDERHMQISERQKSIQTHGPQSQKFTYTQASEMHPTPQVPLAAKAGSLHTPTKPSNEVTRNYIPKAGMTTYTIVPPKSLDKLRFFEVELTLESSSMPGVQEVTADTLDHRSSSSYKFENRSGSPSQPPYIPSPEKQVPPPVRCESRSGSASSLSQSIPSSPVSTEVKEKKVPPSIRPKPASFRLPQHNKTPGSYVSSAAVRSMSLSDSSETGSPQKETFPMATEDCFPPPPPPIQWEDERETRNGQHVPLPMSPLKQENGNRFFSLPRADVSSGSAHSVLSRQSSLPATSLSLEKLRSFAAPKPYSPNPPRSFAQTVFSTAKRTQSLNYSPVGQSGHKVPLALTRHSPLRESDELPDSPTDTDVEPGPNQRKSRSDSFPTDDTDEVWKRRTTDLSLPSESNAHYV
ncbi:cordon-bleu protein-like 1b [Trichomycterus rosablanca]|uniref:cordon-bleu protein-like 1b n=1 Tax=Trichomycterus rosablanca TaxID=2290929 RepID=UPI002F35F73A